MSDEVVKPLERTTNFEELSALAGVGVRRAAAFLKMALVACDHPPSNLTLDGGIAYKFLNDPETPEAVDQLRDEYRAWVVGCGLKELDHYFSLFLDRVWYVAELVRLHGTQIPSSYRFDHKFQQDTNVASKLETVATALALNLAVDSFQSLKLGEKFTHARCGHCAVS